MALNYFDDQQEQQQNQQTAPQGTQQVGTSSGIITGGGGNNTGSPTHSGTFTNLQDYLSANQGKDMGNTVSNKLQNTLNNASQAVNSADQQFKGQVDKSTVNYDQDLVNSALSDPTKFVGDASQLSKFDQLRDAQWTGPNTLSATSGYNPAASNVQQAQQETSATQSDGGRQALLQKYFGTTNPYTRGESSLDNLLLQTDQNFQSGADKAKQQTSDLTKNWSQTQTADQNYASQARGTTENTRSQTRQALGVDDQGNLLGAGALPSFQSDVNQRVSAAQQQQQANYNKYLKDFLDGKISYSEAQAIGIPVTQPIQTNSVISSAPHEANTYDANYYGSAMPTYGVNFSKYLDQGSPVTRFKASTADDFAKAAALYRLAGQDNTFLPGSNASQAGTAAMNPTFDAASFSRQLATNKAQHDLSVQNEMNATSVTVPGYMGTYLPIGTPGLKTNSDGSITMNLNQAHQAYFNYAAQNQGKDPAAVQSQWSNYDQNILPKIQAVYDKYKPSILNIT